MHIDRRVSMLIRLTANLFCAMGMGMVQKNGNLTPAAFIRQFVKAQTDLAAKVGWSTAYVSDLLSGKRIITAHKADMLADALTLTYKERQMLHRLGALAQGWDI